MTALLKLFRTLFITIFPLIAVSLLSYSLLGYHFSFRIWISRIAAINVDFLTPFVRLKEAFLHFDWEIFSDNFQLSSVPILNVLNYIAGVFKTLGDFFFLVFERLWYLLRFVFDVVVQVLLLIYQIICVFIPLDYLLGL